MRIKRLPLLCLATVASAQATTQTLGDVLTAQSATLSTLNTWLASEQAVYSVLSNAQGVTLLAPSNNALNHLYSTSLATQLGQDANLLTAFLSYHVLSGTYSVSDLTAASPSSSIPTFLDIAAYSNVTGGQRIEPRAQNGVITFISGSGTQSNIESSVSHTAAQTYPPHPSTSAPNHQTPPMEAELCLRRRHPPHNRQRAHHPPNPVHLPPHRGPDRRGRCPAPRQR